MAVGVAFLVVLRRRWTDEFRNILNKDAQKEIQRYNKVKRRGPQVRKKMGGGSEKQSYERGGGTNEQGRGRNG